MEVDIRVFARFVLSILEWLVFSTVAVYLSVCVCVYVFFFFFFFVCVCLFVLGFSRKSLNKKRLLAGPKVHFRFFGVSDLETAKPYTGLHAPCKHEQSRPGLKPQTSNPESEAEIGCAAQVGDLLAISRYPKTSK